MRALGLSYILVAALAGAGCRVPLDRATARGEAAITPAALVAPVRFLSDDLLEGRAPGTRGDEIARRYVASAMETIGLEPAGSGGGWEQPVELLGVTSLPPPTWAFSRGGRAVSFARTADFVAVAGGEAERVAIDDAEVVFVGYGIQAPEYDWDDFKGADLRGKVLLVLNDDPNWDPSLFAGKRRLYYGRWTYKFESAARQGAVGAIIVHTRESAAYPWQTVQTSWTGENSRLPGGDQPEVRVKAWLTDDASRRLAALGGHDLNALVEAARSRDFRPVPLGVRTRLRIASRLRRYRTANVVGRLPGRDSALAGEYVVYSAHHDHLGRGPARDGDDIRNGALDNAAGVAQMLAVARAFATLPERPRRSVLFLAVAAEEQGLLGSEQFARDPTVPAADIVADINFDGGNIWGRTRDMALVGFGKSTLDDAFRSALDRQHRTLVDEPFPEYGTFYRSDQFNFARVGVPAVFPRTGTDFVGRPEGWGRAQIDAWIDRHYHQPSDEMDASWTFDGMVDDARACFAAGLVLANADRRPAWNAGDEFAGVRSR